MASGTGDTPLIPRRALLRAAAAIWGLAIAIALFPIVVRPARPGQLPGLTAALNVDAGASFRFAAVLVVLPLLAPWLLKPILAIFERDETQAWARNAAIAGMLVPLWFVSIEPLLAWAVIPTACVVAAVLAMRRVDAAFTRHDVILLPVFATVFLALIDIKQSGVDKYAVVAAAIVFATRLAVPMIPRLRPLPPAECFALAPLGLVLQSAYMPAALRHSGWPPLMIAAITPFLLRLLLHESATIWLHMRRAVAFVIFPIVTFTYGSATGLLAAEGAPRGELFENAHVIVPAAEMLRGEKPYRDIIPPHGLGSDALLSYVSLRTGPMTLGRLLRIRDFVENLNRPAGYLLAFAATGSPEAGLLASFLAEPLATAGGQFRILPAILTLALLAAALRTRSQRLLTAASIGTVIAIVTGFDFGLYAIVAATAAVLMFRESRTRAVRRFALAGGISAAAVAIVLAAWGILPSIIRFVTAGIPALRPAYTLAPLNVPEGLKTYRFPPEELAALFDKSSGMYVLWFVVLIVFAVALALPASGGRRGRRFDAVRVIAVFVLICTISYAERHHLYFRYVFAPLIVSVIFLAFRSRMPMVRAIAPALVVIVLMIAQPTIHLGIVTEVRRARGPMNSTWREVALPRARGAIFSPTDAKTIELASMYTQTHFAPNDTFFDFTNQGALYFLLDRDCPIPQLEVAFYESEAAQREVIARLEANPRVRAALVPPPNPPGLIYVDRIPNSTRAPLVWAWLQQHFEPDFAQDGVLFWRRK